MSFFSSEAFLNVVADVFYPGRAHDVEAVAVAGRVFRLLIVDGAQVVTHAPFLDYFEAMPVPAVPEMRQVRLLPRAVLGIATAAAWQERHLEERYEPSPYIDWRAFADWSQFVSYVHARSPHPFNITLRKRRKLVREVGDIEYRRTPFDAQLLTQCMAWKSEQYRRSAMVDLFAAPKPRELFFELGRRNLLTLDALSAGGRVLAIHAGVLWDGRSYYWLPAHDPEMSAYSPGTLLLERLIEESFATRSVFDFLLGNEPYKWWYATHTRLIGPVGAPAAHRQLIRVARDFAVGQVRHFPETYALLQSLKRRWRESRLLSS